MYVTSPQIRLFAALFAFWLLLSGSLALGSLAGGLVAAGAVAWLFRDNLSVLSGYRMSAESLAATFGFLGYFLAELVRANIDLARVVLTPGLPIDPAIVKVRTRLTDPVARLLLANAITLTPGTLSVEIEGQWLYVHWVVARATDAEAATEEIVAGFERYLEVMYG